MAKAVRLDIDRGEIEQPLRRIHDFVERIITEPLCTAQVFGSKELDELCRRIGQLSLSRMGVGKRDRAACEEGVESFAYVVTKLQKSGGHTRLVEDFINARPEARHVILSTELSGKSDLDYLATTFPDRNRVSLEMSPRGGFQHRLAWLQGRLLKIGPRHTYLFNHHQDSVAVAAVQPEIGEASYCHHGDHHLCLGVHLSHVRHIDPHPMGYHNCRDHFGIDNVYVPLTIADKGARSLSKPFLESGRLTTCTAARSNKVEIPYFTSYVDLIPRLLSITAGAHVHIGRLSPWALYKIRLGLKRKGIAADRFIYVPWVASVWQALKELRVDLYIASFPYGGGLTLIEAMGAGIPVVLHQHVVSRVLSGIELAYPEAFSWRNPEDLLNHLATLNPESLRHESSLARKRYEETHQPELLREFLSGQNCKYEPPPLDRNFHPKTDEWACWIESQLSVAGVIRRALYRLARRARSRFA